MSKRVFVDVTNDDIEKLLSKKYSKLTLYAEITVTYAFKDFLNPPKCEL